MSSKTEVKETPLMKQYNRIKAKYPDALLLFRVGDFYETFGADAVRAAKVLDIVLTKRKNGAAATIELAGFPHHSLDTYLPKLVRAGFRVAICDQLEDPKTTKTIVKRGVTELVTPGVTYNDSVLDGKSNNFLAAIHFQGDMVGISFLDISTGEYLVAEGRLEYAEKLLQGFKPSEVLVQKQSREKFYELFGQEYHTFGLEDWAYSEDFGKELLMRHFKVKSLKGFGIEEMTAGVVAAGAALHYLGETKHDDLSHLSSISRISEEKYVWLDRFTIRNLELIHSTSENGTSLIQILDETASPMGSRMLKRWVLLPLKDYSQINERLEIVEFFIKNTPLANNILEPLKAIGDLERLISKAATGRINPREVYQLKRALDSIVPIKDICEKSSLKSLQHLGDQLNLCIKLRERIETEIQEDAPALVHKGGIIRAGVHEELDELRDISFKGKDYLQDIQERESAITGIPSLKIAYNNVFGYYLEVRNSHKDKVPSEWIRKQTLTQAERYITEELKIYEGKILGAEEKISVIESRLFQELVDSISEYVGPIQLNAGILAKIDCLLGFAEIAQRYNYSRPELNDGMALNIVDGRHPVIEHHLQVGEKYVSNDIYLDTESQQIAMITGPNMSGKSALLRQTALIVLMAQIGSFVPAKSAHLGLTDKIFTRVGASDNISGGESTFMVEMNETASILNNLSERSLILLDEIGRGTSTYDGISIAWSIAEFLHNHPKYKAKTLFATHYHELNDMSQLFPRIKNFNVSVKEVNNTVLFLRKLAPGGSNHSFGIHVAQMAGMPREVIHRAEQVLIDLEKSHAKQTGSASKAKRSKDELQLSFFQLDDPVLIQIKEEILQTDINTLTPVEALMKLNEIKKMVGGK